MSVSKTETYTFTNVYPDELSQARRDTPSNFLPTGSMMAPIQIVEEEAPELVDDGSCPTPSLQNNYQWLTSPETTTSAEECPSPSENLPEADEIVIEGWLKKQGGSFKGWKERWCVMYRSGLFRYYSKSPDQTEGFLNEEHRKGKGDVSFLFLKTHGQEGHFFWLATPQRMWNFAAKNEEEAEKWLELATEPDRRRRSEERRNLHEGYSSDSGEIEVERPGLLVKPSMLSVIHKAPSPSKTLNVQSSPETSEEIMRSAQTFLQSRSLPDLHIEKDHSIIKEGWLKKQGGKLGLWRKRYCVLYKTGLFRYYTDESKMPEFRKGKGDTSFAKLKDYHQSGNRFTVETSERVWELEASDVFEASGWLVLHFLCG